MLGAQDQRQFAGRNLSSTVPEAVQAHFTDPPVLVGVNTRSLPFMFASVEEYKMVIKPLPLIVIEPTSFPVMDPGLGKPAEALLAGNCPVDALVSLTEDLAVAARLIPSETLARVA